MLEPLSAAVTNAVWSAVRPSTLMFCLLAFWFVGGHRHLWLRRIGQFTITALLTLALTPLGLVPIYLLEAQTSLDRPRGGFSGIIILAGAERPRATEAYDQVVMNDAGERLTEALRLWLDHPKALLIHSGGGAGKGPLRPKHVAERLFKLAGMRKNEIIYEDRSTNTRESALVLRDWLKPGKEETWLIVTSAFHVPRSLESFRKAGWNVQAYPVDPKLTPQWWRLFPLHPTRNLALFDLACHEWLGRLYYSLV